jgi:hypothetical protein
LEGAEDQLALAQGTGDGNGLGHDELANMRAGKTIRSPFVRRLYNP